MRIRDEDIITTFIIVKRTQSFEQHASYNKETSHWTLKAAEGCDKKYGKMERGDWKSKLRRQQVSGVGCEINGFLGGQGRRNQKYLTKQKLYC